MGMTIDDCIDYFNRSFAIDNTDDARQHNEVLEMTIDTMRKYQKIQEIVNSAHTRIVYDSKFEDIKKVVEDGNDDNKI